MARRVRSVRAKVSRPAKTTPEKVSPSPLAPRLAARGPEPTGVASAGKGQSRARKTKAEGLAIIVGPAAEKGFGARSFLTGAPGSGKTTLMQAICEALLAYGVADLVLVHDAKNPTPQYQGQVFPSVSALVLTDSPPTGIVVLHSRDAIETPDRVADAVLSLARAGLPCAAVIDELYDALSSPQQFETGDKGPIPTIERKGRSLRASIVTGTQMPQTIPSVVFDLAETRVLLRTDSRSVDYLASKLRLSDEVAGLISRLDVGEFVINRAGFEWDGIVYGPS